MSIQDFDRAEVLALQPGDTLVLTTSHSYIRTLSVEAAQRLREELKALFPDNLVLVLSDDQRLSVVSKVDRIEQMQEQLETISKQLAALVNALADDERDGEEPSVDLEGQAAGGPREAGQPL